MQSSCLHTVQWKVHASKNFAHTVVTGCLLYNTAYNILVKFTIIIWMYTYVCVCVYLYYIKNTHMYALMLYYTYVKVGPII